MISIKPYESKFAKEVGSLLKEVHLDLADFNDLNQMMVVVEGMAVIGVCHYSINGNGQPVVDVLYILDSFRGMKLGDGLIRATLNALFLRGYKSTYLMSNETLGEFYDHMEFEKLLSEISVSTPYYIRDGKIIHMVSDIDAFFSKPCKSERR